jgi:NADPH2:quinone reductase
VALDAARCTPIPDDMPFDEAAAFILTYGTSYYALKDRGRLKAGETLLVLGAAGGVGLAAVELGKAAGARVIAACSSQEKVDLAIKHGADAGVVYPRGPFDKDGQKALATLIKDACGPNGWDVAYDAVGGDYSEATIRAAGWNGRFLVIGFPSGIPKIPLNLTLLKSCDIVGVFWGASVARDPKGHVQNVKDLMALYAAGKIKPLPPGQGRRRHRPPGQPQGHGQGRGRQRIICDNSTRADRCSPSDSLRRSKVRPSCQMFKW